MMGAQSTTPLSDSRSATDQSADMRRVFARKNRGIPLIGRDGGYFVVEPRTHVIRPAHPGEFPQHGPYKDETPQAEAAD